MGGRGSCSLSFKVLLAAVATAMLVLLLLAGALESGATKMTRTQTVLDSIAQDDLKRRHEELIGREKLVYNPELDLNFVMNKRKVPNGPDPIHNRRAGNSKRPPGRG
ncbi:PREDICTED: CLAVATA3/ESR (CLE)-related protein 25-like [Populus euphratica]|uniref:CLAVATA3/ESR (CLE)-related protein 25-like n=1 Tax=Populus euphratica TaxID=75702 RepID=A0AAJ6XX19_POPEU|nr:PREDICTED: CLAVATA3/ESR (CLE)-related protein 25-like [Populus euphratica]